MLGTTNERVAVQPKERLQSLDAYRGLIMITLSFVGFGLAGTSANYLKDQPDSTFWQAVNYQFSHAQWVGCSYWDLIQPSFMFMVGVSMAFFLRKAKVVGAFLYANVLSRGCAFIDFGSVEHLSHLDLE